MFIDKSAIADRYQQFRAELNCRVMKVGKRKGLPGLLDELRAPRMSQHPA